MAFNVKQNYICIQGVQGVMFSVRLKNTVKNQGSVFVFFQWVTSQDTFAYHSLSTCVVISAHNSAYVVVYAAGALASRQVLHTIHAVHVM